MQYKSKHDAKQWSMETLGHGGLIATIPTPFHDDTMELHEEDLRNTIRYVIDCKNDGLFFLGNVGEFFSMTREERIRVNESHEKSLYVHQLAPVAHAGTW